MLSTWTEKKTNDNKKKKSQGKVIFLRQAVGFTCSSGNNWSILMFNLRGGLSKFHTINFVIGKNQYILNFFAEFVQTQTGNYGCMPEHKIRCELNAMQIYHTLLSVFNTVLITGFALFKMYHNPWTNDSTKASSSFFQIYCSVLVTW